MAKPSLLMLLSRHPVAERSGRAVMLRQRIEQAKLRFEPTLVVFGSPVGDARDEGLQFVPMASPASIGLNAFRLSSLPLQAWLYFSECARARIESLRSSCKASAVYVDMLRLAPLVTPTPEGVSLIVDFDDLLSQRYAAAGSGYEVMGFLSAKFGPFAGIARAFSAPLLRAEAIRCARYEQVLLARADLSLFTSPKEAARARLGKNVRAAPPLAAPKVDLPWQTTPGERLIFLGNLHYAENLRMLRLLADAMAALERDGAAPGDAVIEVVGDHLPDLPQAFDPKRFRFRGHVANLNELAGAGIFLAPVVGGSGVKVKILDGMALGCPVVATPMACEGLDVRANRDLLVASSARDVLTCAVALRARPRLRQMLSQRALRYLQRVHAPEVGVRIADAMAATLSQETL